VSEDFKEQKDLIAGICQRLGVDYKELADAGGINRETMRKYAGGYQRMPEKISILLRHIETERTKNTRADDRSNPSPAGAAFGMLETETLDKSLADLATRLKKAAPHERKFVLSNLQSVLDELQQRDLKPLNSSSTHARGGQPDAGKVVSGKNP
jgi:hypothetical protein